MRFSNSKFGFCVNDLKLKMTFSFSSMILFDAAVLSKILVIMIMVGEGQMDSMEGEQGNHMVRGIKMPLPLVRGKRDFMDYEDLKIQVIQNKYTLL